MNIIDALDLFSEKRIKLKIRKICECLLIDLMDEYNNNHSCWYKMNNHYYVYNDQQKILYDVDNFCKLWMIDNIKGGFKYIELCYIGKMEEI